MKGEETGPVPSNLFLRYDAKDRDGPATLRCKKEPLVPYVCVLRAERTDNGQCAFEKAVALGSVRTGVLGSVLSTYTMVHNHP